MKKFLSIIAITFFLVFNAQVKDSIASPKKLYVKVNAVFIPVGMLNVGLEHQLNKKWTLQGEIFVSPWKSFLGKYALFGMANIEVRYYFSEAFKHWYVGGNFNFAGFKIQKYGYWGGPYQYEPGEPLYDSKYLYQTGFAFMLGATVGYQWQINDKWNLDLFVGGGHSEGFYNGYVKNTNIRYEHDSRDWNRSGEWIPYKGGLMVSYRLK